MKKSHFFSRSLAFIILLDFFAYVTEYIVTHKYTYPINFRPTCDNHDDGETLAIILCDQCGNLCADCDRFLHLHRKTKGHQRQVFKEEEDAIKVDLHEGCGRTKLFWLMALGKTKRSYRLISVSARRKRIFLSNHTIFKNIREIRLIIFCFLPFS